MTSLYGGSPPRRCRAFGLFRRVAFRCATSITEVQRLPGHPPGGAPASSDRRTPGHSPEEDQRAFIGRAAWSQRSHHRARPGGAGRRGRPDLRPAGPWRRLPAREMGGPPAAIRFSAGEVAALVASPPLARTRQRPRSPLSTNFSMPCAHAAPRLPPKVVTLLGAGCPETPAERHDAVRIARARRRAEQALGGGRPPPLVSTPAHRRLRALHIKHVRHLSVPGG